MSQDSALAFRAERHLSTAQSQRDPAPATVTMGRGV
jgi:hypothetical protein